MADAKKAPEAKVAPEPKAPAFVRVRVAGPGSVSTMVAGAPKWLSPGDEAEIEEIDALSLGDAVTLI